MNKQHYELRLQGLDAAHGQIKAQDLYRVLGALLKVSERSTRLLATGESNVSGVRPAWLEDSIDFTVTGLKKGSTILKIETPLLADTAKDQFSQKEFWRESPEPGDTALDLAAFAIQEAQSVTGTGDRFDASVLDAVLEFKKAIRSSEVKYQLKSTSRARGAFELGQKSFESIAERKQQLPEPKAFIVSGLLDEIKHSAGRFRMFLRNGQNLLGRVHPEYLEGESLRHLWGNQVTVEGMVHFKANGQARLIEARRLSLQASGDEIFEALPMLANPQVQGEFFADTLMSTKHVDPMILWGTWPGDEPVEELMLQLSQG